MPVSRALAASALGQSPDDAELLKKDVAKLRAENAALRQRDRLRQQNMALRERNATRRDSAGSHQQAAVTSSQPVPQQLSSAAALGTETGSPAMLMDYAGDVPPDLLFKAPVPARGQFSFWVEGGAIWSGGDPVYNFYPTGGYGIPVGSSLPGFFSFVPHVGWDAATGFDYRFANSPWHVSGEVRYGQSKISDSAAGAGSLSIAGVSINSSQSVVGTDNETHWLADFTVGRDLGIGQDAMQVKGGIRFAQITADSGVASNRKLAVSGIPTPIPTIGGGTTTSLSITSLYNNTLNSSFLGAGPVIGAQGSVPFWGQFAFDYRADAAVLFGSQKVVFGSTTSTTISPMVAIIGPGSFTTGPTALTDKTVAVFNGDLQAGFSYWVNPHVKVTASYRLDAFFGALKTIDAAGNGVSVNRYYQGPQLAVTATF